MATLNKTKKERVYTHEGAIASKVGAEEELRRSVMSCMLWENSFYEDGESIADRICNLVKKVNPAVVSEIAIEARTEMKLRHAPLLIARAMAKINTHKKYVSKLLPEIIQRPDELTEFLAIYWKDGKTSISSQVKKGLAKAFTKFNEYSLAKYNRDGNVKLKDVLFLSHAKPETKVQERLWKKLINGTLKTPDTWEVQLSAGKDKKRTWSRLIREEKLGALALLRNLRNMDKVDVPVTTIKSALKKMNVSRVLPFRFITAAKYAPDYEPELEAALYRCVKDQPKLPGTTLMVVDVSGSMYGQPVSRKSEIDRAQAACALAMLTREICEDPIIYATAGDDYLRKHKTKKVPARRGFALSDAIHDMCNPLGGGGIFLKQVMDYLAKQEERRKIDRVIVITDEQDCDSKTTGAPSKAVLLGKHNYILNVNTYQNGIGYGRWTHINGWSEAVLDYIRVSEETKNAKSRTKKNSRSSSKSLQRNGKVRR